jgi:hypothetical protein
LEDEGRTLIYEGHDVSRTTVAPDPKKVDQPERNPGGSLTQNGRFAEAAQQFKEGLTPPERVRVYEKIRSGIWVYNGLFDLVDCWTEQSGGRSVFKFKLRFAGTDRARRAASPALEDDRIVPSWVKLEVWKRDRGRCAYPACGAISGLHFDHIIPYTKGGSSKDPANIQILCGRHNLAKRDNIEWPLDARANRHPACSAPANLPAFTASFFTQSLLFFLDPRCVRVHKVLHSPEDVWFSTHASAGDSIALIDLLSRRAYHTAA